MLPITPNRLLVTALAAITVTLAACGAPKRTVETEEVLLGRRNDMQ